MKVLKILVFGFLLSSNLWVHPSVAVGPGFTYQGRYEEGGVPFNGTLHLRFSLWDMPGEGDPPVGGTQLGVSQLIPNITVADGFFMVLLNPLGEFGPGAFDGADRWLQIEVCANQGCGTLTILNPRQPISGTPYALGPWSLSGPNISYTHGNVGIGTKFPARPLEIANGRMRFSSGNGDIEFIEAADLLTYATTTSPAPNAPALRVFTGTAPTSVMTVLNNGNVGFGSTSPTSRLEVFGQDAISIRGFQPFLTLKDTNSSDKRGVIQSAAGSLLFYPDSHLGAAPGMILATESGNLGIGKNDPIAQLHVNSTSSNKVAIHGFSTGHAGVFGKSTTAVAVVGNSDSSYGVAGRSEKNYGVWGASGTHSGIYGVGPESGVFGISDTGHGVQGYTTADFTGPDDIHAGVHGVAENSLTYGVWAEGRGSAFGLRVDNTAIFSNYVVCDEDVFIAGELRGQKSSLRLDHPLDPGSQYLDLTGVNSSETLNLYTGNVVTGATAHADVFLPDWFETINTDFRYQLTVVGQMAQAVVSQEIQDNRFEIQTDKPNVKVSWQVTAVRNDPYAKANPHRIEVKKPKEEQGKYLHPELYGQPKEKGIHYFPEVKVPERLSER